MNSANPEALIMIPANDDTITTSLVRLSANSSIATSNTAPNNVNTAPTATT